MFIGKKKRKYGLVKKKKNLKISITFSPETTVDLLLLSPPKFFPWIYLHFFASVLQ